MATEASTDHGKTLLEWEFAEFTKHQRGFWWYVLTTAAAVGMIIWAIIDRNILFAIIILIAAMLYFALSRREPGRITIRLTEDGIEVGRNFYAYSELKDFWLFYRPPDLKKLYIHFKTALRPSLTVPLEDQNPVTLREVLLRYLPEDVEQEEEPATDELSRRLKL
jgi:hypothetical protein